jgi:hypothetical protein
MFQIYATVVVLWVILTGLKLCDLITDSKKGYGYK